MIQRIQTILLFLAAAINPITLFLDLWKFEFNSVNSQSVIIFSGQHIKNLSQTPSLYNTPYPIRWVLIIGVAMILAALVSIFLYKKRKLQKRIAWVAAGFAFLQAVYIFGRVYLTQNQIGKLVGPNGLQSSSLEIGCIVPLISMGLCIFAAYRIEKDDQLVKDMNTFRLRD